MRTKIIKDGTDSDTRAHTHINTDQEKKKRRMDGIYNSLSNTHVDMFILRLISAQSNIYHSLFFSFLSQEQK